jgi:hypothetical protein
MQRDNYLHYKHKTGTTRTETPVLLLIRADLRQVVDGVDFGNIALLLSKMTKFCCGLLLSGIGFVDKIV